MRKFVLNASLWFCCTLVVATPRPLSWKAIISATSAEEAPTNRISTALTLGPTRSVSANLSPAPPSPQAPRRSLHLPTDSEPRLSLGHQPPPRPWYPGQVPPLADSSSTHELLLNTVASATQQDWRPPPFPLTPRLDASIEQVLRHPPYQNYMKLPQRAQYVHSVWFNIFYHHAIRASTQSKRLLEELPLSTIDLYRILGANLNSRTFLHPGKSLFKVPIPLPTSPIVEPGEVLVRFHNKITLEGRDRLRTHMSVWSTMDNGDSLAFLGLYPMPDRLFENLMRQTQARKFRIALRQDDSRLYLEPTNGEQARV